jgi:hypothetical protein
MPLGGSRPAKYRKTLEDRKMVNSEQSGSGGRTDWRVRLATGVGTGVGATVALLVRPDLGSFWLGMIAFLAVTGVGALLGRLVGSLLVRRPPGN